MKVQVKLYATLRKYLPGVPLGQATSLELPDNALVGDILDKLQIPREEAKVIFINRTHKELSDPLQSDDVVVIFPPMGGG